MSESLKIPKTLINYKGKEYELSCPVYGNIDVIKALQDRRRTEEKEMKDYEAYRCMHKYDGTFTKPTNVLSRL